MRRNSAATNDGVNSFTSTLTPASMYARARKEGPAS